MFYYFGRKARLAPLYPAPEHPLVIEPFAGSMAYTFHYRPAAALGIDANSDLVRVWKEVVGMTPEEILAYPEPALGERVCDRWSMLAAGSHGTAVASSYLWTERMSRDLRKQKRLAARLRDYADVAIEYRHGNFDFAPAVEATWFIDPPYQKVGRGYGGERLDYAALAEFVMTRRGLVVVCEQMGADWLPFAPLAEIKGTTNKRTTEVVFVRRS